MREEEKSPCRANTVEGSKIRLAASKLPEIKEEDEEEEASANQNSLWDAARAVARRGVWAPIEDVQVRGSGGTPVELRSV